MSSSLTLKYVIQLASNIGQQVRVDEAAITQSQTRIQQTIKKTNDQFYDMGVAISKSGGDVEKLRREIDKLGSNTSTQRQITYMATLGQAVDRVAERARRLKTSLAEGARLLEKAPALFAGGAAGLYTANRLMSGPIDFDLQLRYAAATAYGGKSAAEVRGGMAKLRGTVNNAVRKFGGSREQALQGYGFLVGTGEFNAQEADQLLPMLQEAATSTATDVQDIANLSMRVKSVMKVPAEKMRSVYSKLARVGQLGGVELNQQARYIADLSGNYGMLGYTGERGAVAAAVDLQLAFKNAGSTEGARTILDNFYGKTLSADTAKDFAKIKGADGRGIDLFAEMARRRAQGKDGVEAFLDLTDSVLARDGSDKRIGKILSGSNLKNAAQYEAASGAVKEVFERAGIGSFLQDKEALRGYLALSTGRGERSRMIDAAMGDTGATMDVLTSVIQDSPAIARQKALAESAIALDGAFQKIAPTITSMLTGTTALAQEYPKSAEALAGLAAAATVASAALGAAGFAGILMRGGGVAASAGTAASATAQAGFATRAGVVGAGLFAAYQVGRLGVALKDLYDVEHREGVQLTPEARGRVQYLNRDRDWLSMTSPQGQTQDGSAHLVPTVQVGQGTLKVEVQVKDDRVTATAVPFADMPLLRIDSGHTNPGGY